MNAQLAIVINSNQYAAITVAIVSFLVLAYLLYKNDNPDRP